MARALAFASIVLFALTPVHEGFRRNQRAVEAASAAAAAAAADSEPETPHVDLKDLKEPLNLFSPQEDFDEVSQYLTEDLESGSQRSRSEGSDPGDAKDRDDFLKDLSSDDETQLPESQEDEEFEEEELGGSDGAAAADAEIRHVDLKDLNEKQLPESQEEELDGSAADHKDGDVDDHFADQMDEDVADAEPRTYTLEGFPDDDVNATSRKLFNGQYVEDASQCKGGKPTYWNQAPVKNEDKTPFLYFCKGNHRWHVAVKVDLQKEDFEEKCPNFAAFKSRMPLAVAEDGEKQVDYVWVGGVEDDLPMRRAWEKDSKHMPAGEYQEKDAWVASVRITHVTGNDAGVCQ